MENYAGVLSLCVIEEDFECFIATYHFYVVFLPVVIRNRDTVF